MALAGGRFASPYVQSCAKYNVDQQAAEVKIRSYSELGTSSSIRYADSKDSSSINRAPFVSFTNPNYEPSACDSDSADHLQVVHPAEQSDKSAVLAGATAATHSTAAVHHKELERVRRMEESSSPPRPEDASEGGRLRASSMPPAVSSQGSSMKDASDDDKCQSQFYDEGAECSGRDRSNTVPLPTEGPPKNSGDKHKKRNRAWSVFSLLGQR